MKGYLCGAGNVGGVPVQHGGVVGVRGGHPEVRAYGSRDESVTDSASTYGQVEF